MNEGWPGGLRNGHMKINRANFSLLILLLVSAASYAQTTAFSYQGRLSESGTPVTGTRHFRFTLFDEGGVAIPGATIEQTLVVSSGVFNTTLDFGEEHFPAADRSLLIEVKVNLGDSYTVLSPRQQILSTPFSIKSKSADTATSATTASTATNATQLGGVAADQYVTNTTLGTNAIRNQTTQQSAANFNISGSGTIGGNLLLGNGTQSSPALTFSSDSGTGLFRSAASTLNFSTGGFSRMFLTSDGKLGIGVFGTPLARLHVEEGGNKGLRVANNLPGGTVASFGAFGTFDIDAHGLAGGRFSVLENGNVGIGTGGPTQKLEVIGNARVSGDVIGGTRLCIAADCRSAWPGGVSGSGTTNRLSRFLGPATLGDSQISDDGTNVTIGVNGGGFRVLADALSLSPNIIGGFSGNTVTSGVSGATIGGGGFAGGGGGIPARINTVTDDLGTVGGGSENTAGGFESTVGGGRGNLADGDHSTVPGGRDNTASGVGSFAAGRRAKANHAGTFVWNSNDLSDFASTNGNQFLIRAGGGVGINTNSPFNGGLSVAGTIQSTSGGFVFPDGTVQTTAGGGGGGGGIGGSGTGGFIPKFTAATTLGNSQIFEFGTNVGIGTIGPAHKLEVIGGNIRASGDVIGGTRLCIAADCRSAWPTGGGSGTVTSINAGTGLTSSPNPITTTGTISIDTTVVPRLNTNNNFTGINNFVVGNFTAISNNAVVNVTNNATTGGFGVFATTAANSGSLPAALRGDATATTGSTYGIYGQSFSNSGTGIYGLAQFTGSGTTYGVRGGIQSTNGVGVWGQAAPFDQSGNAIGVQGTTGSTAGSGVSGAALNTNAGSAYGGYFTSVTPGGGGVFGQASNATSTAGVFTNTAGGDIIRGIGAASDLKFKVAGDGNVTADGTFVGGGADFAESVEVVNGRQAYEPGDVLVVDATSNRRFALAREPYSPLVAGVYSTKPGMLGSLHSIDSKRLSEEVPMAIVGIVPTKVTTENGSIQRGDLLVTSSRPGYAMKGTDRSRMMGAVIGKALEPLSKGTGVIEVLVTLQ